MKLDISIGQRQSEFNPITFSPQRFPTDASGVSIQNPQRQRHDPKPLELIAELIAATAKLL
jgi:hypothetical protein